MSDPQNALLCAALTRVVLALSEDATNAQPWAEAQAAVRSAEEKDEELTSALEAKDLEALSAIVEGWETDKRVLPEADRGILKRAMKAYRKRLKLTQLDAESSIGGGPMSSGRSSNILGITPPDRYPREVWDQLVHQGRLKNSGHGMYELPPGS